MFVTYIFLCYKERKILLISVKKEFITIMSKRNLLIQCQMKYGCINVICKYDLCSKGKNKEGISSGEKN